MQNLMIENKGLYLILLSGVLFIWVYWFIMRRIHGDNQNLTEKDIFNRKFINLTCIPDANCCGGWKLLHFILFFVVGYLYPKCFTLAMTLGILWELYEMWMAKMTGREYQHTRTSTNVEYTKSWWDGSMSDVLFNAAGFIIGMLCAQIIKGQ